LCFVSIKADPARGGYLISALQSLLDRIQTVGDKRLGDAAKAMETLREEMTAKLEELSVEHAQEEARLKGQIRGKMLEIHQRDIHIKKIKKQLSNISLYHHFDMNAQVGLVLLLFHCNKNNIRLF